ncbi:MAG: hypothetical protein RL739_1240 [Pseudomonadota bacterium]|jgi:Na+/melibiose symporter-like transporter
MNTAAPALRWPALLRLGAMGFPLAFVALPLYVVLPHHYALTYQLPLAWIGSLLLAARLGDALIDPWLGRCTDGWFARHSREVLAWSRRCALLLLVGVGVLFFPHLLLPSPASPQGLMAVAGLALVACCLGLSCLSLAHQSWGTRHGGDEAQRARVVGWREGLGLLGVISASALSAGAGVAAMVWALALSLALALWAWHHAPTPPRLDTSAAPEDSASTDSRHTVGLGLAGPMGQPLFRGLLAVFVLNGIASAIPATLVLFFVQDRLQAAPGQAGVFLALYFCAAAVSVPLWLAAVRRWGLVTCWLLGMGLAMAVFVWTLGLGTGDTWAFAVVCTLSGLALGADVIAPGALLTGVVERLGRCHSQPGVYWGWWQVATKLNLALAAGLTLPALQWWGYTPGQTDEAGLWTLSCAYGLMPCLLKAAAAVCLWLQRQSLPTHSPTESPP